MRTSLGRPSRMPDALAATTGKTIPDIDRRTARAGRTVQIHRRRPPTGPIDR
ncbi:MAG: hypothetical protein OXB92_09165 [Acidimicrobiaceae bacterium]|nr:hypothetical protein [Acidimicrobiia bacterium]MCY4494009.1 hypothetical protein [Acidimicrobiaceae bacterium]